MLIDLHIHTVATPHHSFWEPTALIEAAEQAQIDLVAVTDHNTTSHVALVQAAAKQSTVQVLSGVEFDTAYGGKLWHTHLYGAAPEHPAVLDLCRAVVARNSADAEALADHFRSQGHRLAFLDELEAERKPHLANVADALVKAGIWPGDPALDDESAGMAYLLAHYPQAYQPLSVGKIIDVAEQTGGVAILAHPGRDKGRYAVPATAADIQGLAERGLHGLEVYYPTHTAAQIKVYEELATTCQLLKTAGSDSHGPHHGLRGTSAIQCEQFLERLDIR